MRPEFKKMVLEMLESSFEIEFIPKYTDYPTELISFKVIDFRELRYLDLKLNFTEPLYVSYNRPTRDEYDRVKMIMIFPQIFKDL